MNALRRWYLALSLRDRRMLAVGVLIVATLLVLGGVLMPLHSAVANAEARLQTRRDDLAWIQRNAPEVRAAASSTVVTDESPIVLVDRTGREAGLGNALRGTAPNGAGGVRVQLESAPFDTLVSWLGNLQSRYGLAIDSITVDRAAQPGVVNASISLSRSIR